MTKRGILYSQLIFMTLSLISCRRKENLITTDKDLKNTSTNQKKQLWLKQYALCSCIKFSFKDDSLLKNDPSFSIYKEITDYGSDSLYKVIDDDALRAALNIQPLQVADYNSRKAVFLGCFNYFESKQLDSLVKRLDKNSSAEQSQ